MQIIGFLVINFIAVKDSMAMVTITNVAITFIIKNGINEIENARDCQNSEQVLTFNAGFGIVIT